MSVFRGNFCQHCHHHNPPPDPFTYDQPQLHRSRNNFPPRQKTCKYFLQGNCRYGSRCWYWHPPVEPVTKEFVSQVVAELEERLKEFFLSVVRSLGKEGGAKEEKKEEKAVKRQKKKKKEKEPERAVKVRLPEDEEDGKKEDDEDYDDDDEDGGIYYSEDHYEKDYMKYIGRNS